jgi:hypothetical protein
MGDSLQDRRDLPIFIHSTVDDLGLTPNAFRVYGHLARRTNRNTNTAWPSYAEIGKVCFESLYTRRKTRKAPGVESENMRRMAIAAVDELIEAGLVRKTIRPGRTSNEYELTPKEEWTRQTSQPKGDMSPLQLPINAIGDMSPMTSDMSLKGTPLEGTPLEDISRDPFLPTETQERVVKKDEPAPAGQREMVGELARLCVMDVRLEGGRLGKVASKLVKAGYSTADLHLFRDWWYKRDWRGKLGQVPKPEQVLEVIPQSKNGGTQPVAGVGTLGRANLMYNERNEIVEVQADPWMPG